MAAMRAAASSIPSGSPSTVAQISITAAAVAGSDRPKSSRTARARSTNSVTASDVTPPFNASGSTDRTVSPSTASGSRDVARIRPVLDRPRMVSTADAAATRTCSQLSTTRRSRRPRRASATVSMTGRVGLGGDAEHGGDGGRDRRRFPHQRQLRHPYAVGELAGHLGRDLEGQPGLADPADARQRDQSAGAHELGQVGHLVLPADQRAALLGEIAGEVSAAPEHGELRGEPVGDDLVHRHPPALPAEPMLTERLQGHPVAQQHLGGVRDEDLTAVRQRHELGGAVHHRADVGAVALDRLAGVQTYAH